jgi:hypothetical protein
VDLLTMVRGKKQEASHFNGGSSRGLTINTVSYKNIDRDDYFKIDIE